ncbi:MAG: hypothetical protein L0Y71_15015 [Gemmataceae bacterium]|nr:hypothetical protein [Gemmataceae bacterium]
MSNDPSATPADPEPNSPAATPAPAPAAAAPAAPPAPAKPPEPQQIAFWQSFLLGMTKPGELPVYHHSHLFYWWPVWLFGFVFAAITWFGDARMAIVPAKTVALEQRQVEIEPGKFETRNVLVLDDNANLVTRRNADGVHEIFQPTIYMSRHKWMGTVFVIALLIVIIITNITLRGLWSVFVLVLIVMLSIIFAVAGWWDTILFRLGQLAIFINLGGYFTLSLILFVFWFVTFFVFDRQTYMIFTPGQVRVRLEIGGGETVFDTLGMVVQKERSDLFRHWVLGFGSGDLVIRPHGLGHALHLPNVLGVAAKVRQIQELVRSKTVVADND